MRQADATPVNNSTTLVSDDTLLFPVSGNSTDVLFVECFLIVSSGDTTSDFKCAWTAPPAGTTVYWGPIAGGGNLGGWNPQSAATTPILLSTSATGTFSFGTFNGISGLYLGLMVFVGGTAGTITLQWAQNTASAVNTLLKAGSFLRIAHIQ